MRLFTKLAAVALGASVLLLPLAVSASAATVDRTPVTSQYGDHNYGDRNQDCLPTWGAFDRPGSRNFNPEPIRCLPFVPEPRPVYRCYPQDVYFDFPAGSRTLTETSGPELTPGELLVYPAHRGTVGKFYTVEHVRGDRFQVDLYGNPVRNDGPSIWDGKAKTVCSIRY